MVQGKLSNNYWIVYVYQRGDRYTFELINYKNKSKKLQKIYYHSEVSLLNTQEKPLVRFLVDQIFIKNDAYINFQFQQFRELDQSAAETGVSSEDKQAALGPSLLLAARNTVPGLLD